MNKTSYNPRPIGCETDKIPALAAPRQREGVGKWALPDYAAKRVGADDYLNIPSLHQGREMPYKPGYKGGGTAIAKKTSVNPKQYHFGGKTI